MSSRKENKEEIEHPSKRQKLDQDDNSPVLQSLQREISPPARFRRPQQQSQPSKTNISQTNDAKIPSSGTAGHSPFRLTRIADLPDKYNVDTVSLADILGRPALSEVWIFDYLFDIEFVMQQFPKETRDSVQVYILHGSWMKDSPHRQRLDEASGRYKNVHPRCAHMPDRFGTHHSKMMVLFEGEECQIVVHTANMIPFDWENMTQGAWFSPKLKKAQEDENEEDVFGSGRRFKKDLMTYLRKYKSRTKELVLQLEKYDFSTIRAAFLASAPAAVDPKRDSTLFGWPGLKQILSSISFTSGWDDTVVAQMSSIATLSETWANHFFGILSTTAENKDKPPMFRERAKMRIVFPTVEEIRNSLNGYESGGSIHLKGSSPAQRKQLGWLRYMFCRWGGDDKDSEEMGTCAYRATAAPHIKTFVRYSADMESISWALLTSANLSTQAWGGMPDADGRVKISSYETGVLVWPEILSDGNGKAAKKMVPVFGRDESLEKDGVVALRLPYNLPLYLYEKDDQPWCKTEFHREKDRLGFTWSGTG